MLHLHHLKNMVLKFVKFEFQHPSSFSCIRNKDGKVFFKNTVKFLHNIAYIVNSFVFHYI